MVHILLVPALTPLYLYVSTFRNIIIITTTTTTEFKIFYGLLNFAHYFHNMDILIQKKV